MDTTWLVEMPKLIEQSDFIYFSMRSNLEPTPYIKTDSVLMYRSIDPLIGNLILFKCSLDFNCTRIANEINKMPLMAGLTDVLLITWDGGYVLASSSIQRYNSANRLVAEAL